MTEAPRPDPDQLLASLQRAEAQGRRGRLKVFLGMCPGVGKTFAMLQDARREAAAGRDVVVGLVETHGRPETAALLAGLTVLPRRTVTYRGVELAELDLDGILARAPGLVLVDELAHTNAPGSRHPKRHQDVEELLAAGFDVHTTLNVQHLASRADVVGQITGARVLETVPDSLFARADEIQLVDLTPDDLRQRLAEGNVYLGDAAGRAADHFFRSENLTALREMALRAAAEHTDRGLRDAMRDRGIPGPWKAGERLLVCVSPSPSSESLIRWTRRMAGALGGTWIAACVDTNAPLSAADRNRLTQHLGLARQLGAEVMTVPGAHTARTLVELARTHNVTQIVVGKSREPRWRQWLRGGSLSGQLIELSGRVDVCVVQPEGAARTDGRLPWAERAGPARDWAEAAGFTAGLTLLFAGLAQFVGYHAIGPLFLLWVVAAGLRYRRPVTLAVGAACALLWNFLFIPPHFTFVISSFHDITMFLMFFVVALATGHLTARLRAGELAGQRRERRMAALFDLTRQTALARDIDSGLAAAARLLENLLGARVALTLRQPDHELSPASHPTSSLALSEKERSVAAWVFSRGTPAGRFTDTLPDADALHLPLQSPVGRWGVLSVQPATDHIPDLGERDLLDAACSLLAAILEKNHFIESFQHAELVDQSERLRRALLDNVSHELKTPVAAIRTALAELARRNQVTTESELLREIEQAGARLERVVALFVDSARIETGLVQPRLEWCEASEIVALARAQATLLPADADVQVAQGTDLPLVRTDPHLLAQALSHVLNNAAVHAPGPVELSAQVADGQLTVTIRDHGPGLADTAQIFEKFHRGAAARPGGLGLGLPISRGLVQALGGTLTASNCVGGGAAFLFRVPVQTETLAGNHDH